MAIHPCHGFAAFLTVCISAFPATANPPCYMLTSSGQKISLAGMCSSNPTSTRRSPSSNYAYPTQQQINQSQSDSRTGDYLVKEGSGGRVGNGIAQDFHYQVWSNRMNTSYTLKVWDINDYPQGSPDSRSGFRSAGEAETHFDCSYVRKRLPACP